MNEIKLVCIVRLQLFEVPNKDSFINNDKCHLVCLGCDILKFKYCTVYCANNGHHRKRGWLFIVYLVRIYDALD